MLKNMRKNVKSLAPVLWAVIIAFVISIFAVWGGAGRLGEGRGSTTIASVGKEKISIDLYVQNLQQRIESLQQQMPELDQNFIQQLNLPQQVLEQIIQQTLLLQVASDMGIQASDAEIAESVKSLPLFQKDGQFVGFEEYQRILNWNRMSASQFEQGLKEDIMVQKVVKVITAGITVSEDELWKNYKKTNESSKLEYLIIPEDKMEMSEEPTREEHQEYFQAHQDEYQVPEKRAGSYVFLNTEELKAEVQINESETEDYYSSNMSQFEDPEAIRVSRIFVPLEGKEAGLVAAEASSLHERVKQGEDFAELAKTQSQDEKAESGGDWGEFEWRRLSQEEQSVIESLEPGELSEVVELADGASLLKVMEKRPATQQPLDQVRDRIQGTLQDQKATGLAEQRISQLEKEAKREKSIEAAAEKLGFTTQSTGSLAEGEALSDIDTSGAISRAMFGLEELEISTPVFTYAGMGLVQLQAVGPTRPSTFEEAESEVKSDLELEKKKQLAFDKAAALKTELQKSAFDQVAEKQGFEFKTAEEHKREQYLGVIGENPDVDAYAFSAPLDQLSDPLPYSNGYIVLKVLDRKEVTQEEFLENKNTELQSILENKRNKVFASFYGKLREEKDVKPNYDLFFQINQQILANFSR